MNFENKIVLVTGGASGIGETITRQFVQMGATVIIYDMDEAKAKALCEELSQGEQKCDEYKADVSSYNDMQTLMKETIDQYGKIDILVNNAGITKDNLLLRMTEEDFDRVLTINLKGTWNMIKAVSPYMVKARYGKIINIASISGVIGNAGQANYAASKAGVIGLTKSVAREFAKRNITCNAVAPGFIETKMTEVLPESVKEHYLQQIPVGRYGQVEDVASLVLFLASKNADYITGQVIHVDGGLVMN
ncbi:MAG: 3-oxoacyl-[acyl-carrier-protein] reductase [Candidatus Marinimicrobia bacterium]|nr:3-oxoacyl-[acyl-carrier-protein] reductase [Candidatus Neomarinimicrobiota bacterium]